MNNSDFQRQGWGPTVFHIICDLNHMRAFRSKIGFLRMVSGIAITSNDSAASKH